MTSMYDLQATVNSQREVQDRGEPDLYDPPETSPANTAQLVNSGDWMRMTPKSAVHRTQALVTC